MRPVQLVTQRGMTETLPNGLVRMPAAGTDEAGRMLPGLRGAGWKAAWTRWARCHGLAEVTNLWMVKSKELPKTSINKDIKFLSTDLLKEASRFLVNTVLKYQEMYHQRLVLTSSLLQSAKLEVLGGKPNLAIVKVEKG